MTKFPLKPGSVMFAPMEGITDMPYRKVLFEHFNEWDSFACDFLRIPSGAPYPEKHILKHYGNEAAGDNLQKNKTIYQILTSEKAKTSETVERINQLGFPWLDINLGCPSKTVVKRKGGSFLLSEPEVLKTIILEAKDFFDGIFTVKIRVGFKDDSLFENNLKLLQDLGVDAIIIHGRTREQLYKGVANWQYIKRAVEILDIPVIGNGDIWSPTDIDRMFETTGCHGVMVARGAMKTPWMAKLYRENLYEEPLESRIKHTQLYFNSLHEAYKDYKFNDGKILKRFKGLSRYIFDDLPEGQRIKTEILRSQSLNYVLDIIAKLSDDNFANAQEPQ